MIPFNVTLVIQMGNFLVSWWVLDRFFFRKCVAQVRKEQRIVRELEQAVIHEKIGLEDVQRAQQEALRKARSLFARSLPSVAQNLSPKVISSHPYVVFQECDVSMQQKLSEEMVSSLVQRVTRV